MLSRTASKETVVIGIVIIGVLAVSYLLPLERFPSLLLVVFVTLVGVVAIVPGAWQTLYRKTGIGAGPWLLAAAVAGSGVSIGYLVGDPQPFCEGAIPYRGCLTVFGWASAIFVASSLGVAIAVGHLDRYRRIRNASAVSADGTDGGMVAVEGRIEPAGRTSEGPVSGEDTVWYRSATEKPTLFRGYREIEHGSEGNRFYVRDGSGRVLVLPDRIDDHAAAEFANSHTDDNGTERRREWSYMPKDAVTVVGHATEVSRAKYSEPVAVGLEGPVIVAKRTLHDLQTWVTRRTVVGAVLAFTIGGISFVVMLLTA